jgi:hypothetical protein
MHEADRAAASHHLGQDLGQVGDDLGLGASGAMSMAELIA